MQIKTFLGLKKILPNAFTLLEEILLLSPSYYVVLNKVLFVEADPMIY